VEEAKEIAQERIELTWEDFEKLEKHVKEEIESATYEEYLMEIGSNDNTFSFVPITNQLKK
jgi:hypothetical protein